MSMQMLVDHLAQALKNIDESGEAHKNFKPGVGPFGEPQLVKKSLAWLEETYPKHYRGACSKRHPDALIPEHWALEFKIVRPYGDNGKEAEHWSENLLHPYPGNVSSLGDCLSLQSHSGSERKGIIVFTFSHSPSRVDLEPLLRSFEVVAANVLDCHLGDRCQATQTALIHPVHEQLTVYGWEVLAS